MYKLKTFISITIVAFMLCMNIAPLGFNLTADAEESDLWLVNNAYARQDVIINNSTGTEFTDIPVFIRLNSTDIPNKNGVGFYYGDTRLSSEKVSEDTNGLSTYWVKIPELAPDNDTVITAYYSNGDVTGKSEDVWTDDYELVQHFSENALSKGKDSTGKFSVIKSGTLKHKKEDLGEASVFDGSQKLVYGNGVVGANAQTYSASAVVNFTSMAGQGGYYGIVCRDRNGAQEGDTFMLTLSNANVNSSVYTNGDVKNRVNVQKGVSEGTTYLLTMTYDGADLSLYINGELVGNAASENAVLLDSELSPFTIGAYSDSELKSGLRGDLYDVFFKTSVISADEETFRYNNYFGNAVTLGELEKNSDTSLLVGNNYLYDAVIGDTYCFSNGDEGRNTNFGADNTVMQKRTNVSDAPDFQSSANRRAFIKMDLSKLSVINPARIESAVFEFYQNGNSGVTNQMKSRIVDINPNSWDEMTVTWNTMPQTYGLPAASTQTITKKQNEYQSFNITEYIKKKLAEGETVISFSIDNDATQEANEWGMTWNSREASENKPRLAVKISEPPKPLLSTELNGTSAILKAELSKDPEDVSEVTFYKAENTLLTEENTVIYSGETDMTLPDTLTVSDADKSESFFEGDKTTAGNTKTPYQIYEITLNEEERQSNNIDINWTGNTGDNQREVTAYFYSHISDKWIKCDSSNGTGDFSLNLNVPVNEALDENGKIQILIWRGMTESIEGRASYAPDTGQYDFNMMWTSDPQFYPTTTVGMNHIKKQFEWIADNFNSTKSKLFINTGDMVDSYDSHTQWQSMSDLYRNTIEKEKIPYAFVVGNHDVNRYDSTKNIFQQYFPVSRMEENNPYFGEKFDDMTYYYLMEENGAKLLVLGMGIPVTQEAVNWVNDVLAKYSDYTVILLTHIYLLADGSIDNTGKYGAEVTVEKVRSVIKNNDNIKLVLCGHWDGANTNLEYFNGRPVWSMLHDYQGHTEGGYGYFRLLKFDIESNLIYTHTYSASNNGTSLYNDKQADKEGLYQKNRDEYAISFDFGAAQERILTTKDITIRLSGITGEQIGTTQTVEGSGIASVEWNGLEEGNTYSWYAVIKDKSGNEIMTDMQSFTVPKVEIDSVSFSNDTVTVNYTASGILNGTPLSIIAFAVDDNTETDTVWNGQNVAYQDIFSYSGNEKSISFKMLYTTENGVAGLDTARHLLIKIGGEYTNTAAKILTLPTETEPEIMNVEMKADKVGIRLNRNIRGNETLIAAVYDKDGILIGVKSETSATLIPEGENEYIINIDSGDIVKIMWWKSMNTMESLCKEKVLENF